MGVALFYDIVECTNQATKGRWELLVAWTMLWAGTRCNQVANFVGPLTNQTACMEGFDNGWNHVCANSGIVAEFKKYHWDLYCPTSFVKSINSPVEVPHANATMHELASTQEL